MDHRRQSKTLKRHRVSAVKTDVLFISESDGFIWKKFEHDCIFGCHDSQCRIVYAVGVKGQLSSTDVFADILSPVQMC